MRAKNSVELQYPGQGDASDRIVRQAADDVNPSPDKSIRQKDMAGHSGEDDGMVEVSKSQKKSLAMPLDEQASNNTPKASSGTAPKNIISQTGEGVKPDEKYSLRAENQLEENKYFARTIDKWSGEPSGGRIKVGRIKENSIYTAVG